MPTPTPEDFLTGEAKRKREFSRNIGEDWNIRQVGADLVGTYKPTGANYPLAGGSASGSLTPWIEVAVFTNSWVNYGAGFPTAAYRKIGDIVYLKGLLKNGVLNNQAFNLPVGYRPATTRHFMTMMTALAGGLRVLSAGDVTFGDPNGGGNGYCSLDGTRFETTG